MANLRPGEGIGQPEVADRFPREPVVVYDTADQSRDLVGVAPALPDVGVDLGVGEARAAASILQVEPPGFVPLMPPPPSFLGLTVRPGLYVDAFGPDAPEVVRRSVTLRPGEGWRDWWEHATCTRDRPCMPCQLGPDHPAVLSADRAAGLAAGMGQRSGHRVLSARHFPGGLVHRDLVPVLPADDQP